jgi:phage protein D
MASSSNGVVVADFDVSINGSALPATAMMYVNHICVDESVDLPSMFTILMKGSDAQNTLLPWVDEDLFGIGNAIEIKLGEQGQLKSVFIGEITALEPEFTSGGLPSLTVRGYDRRHRLQRGRKTRTFLKQKDSEIASKIGADAGLTVNATDSSTSHDYVIQASQTDWEFLCERAARINYEVLVQDKTLLFRPAANSDGEVLTLDPTIGLSQFSPRLSSAAQATEVNVQSWSIKDKQKLVGKAKSGDEVSTMGGNSVGAKVAESAFGSAVQVLTEYPVAVQGEADQLAKARFNEQVLEFISGEGSCGGRTDLHAGKVIKIDGIGKRFGGKYYVTSAVHRYWPHGDYRTDFVVRRNAT